MPGAGQPWQPSVETCPGPFGQPSRWIRSAGGCSQASASFAPGETKPAWFLQSPKLQEGGGRRFVK